MNILNSCIRVIKLIFYEKRMPHSIKIKIRDTNLFIKLFLFGIKVKCPICGWKGAEFLPCSVDNRKNARCPRCNSFERHRLYFIFLKQILINDRSLKVMHVAPEDGVSRLFQSYNNIDYLSVDLNPDRAMKKEDLTDMSFINDMFDFIFCSHVLEHIKDDKSAMRELYRVLKPGGSAVVQVPMGEQEKTLEDPKIISPEDRLKFYGQSDHVRLYGRDYKSKLEESGFIVEEIRFIETLPNEDVKKFALLPNNGKCVEAEGFIYLCKK